MFSKDQKNFLTVILMFECVKNGANRHYTNMAKTSIEKDFENLTRDEINAIYMYVESFFDIPNLYIKNEFFKSKLIEIKRKLLHICNVSEVEMLMKEKCKDKKK
jgi:hypothetical protein